MYESDDDEPNEKLQKKIDKDRESLKPTVKPQVKSPTNKFASFISEDNPSTSSSKVTPQRAQPKTPPKPKKEPQYKPFDKLMDDVVFVISGYQNPERGTLRQKALDMGARYKGDWDNSCTHLM
jgi:DNA-repair protein XRCC1